MLESSGDGAGRLRVRRGAVTPTRLRRRVAVAFVLAVGVGAAVGLAVVVVGLAPPAAVEPTSVSDRARSTRPMITATIPLEETLAGIARIRSGEAVKIVIKP